MKVVTVLGARPQFIKAAPLSRALRKRHNEILVHTGQHYDHRMSGIFFDGLEIPEPAVNLEVGSGSHGAQTAAMLEGIERVLLQEKPDWVIVYGDTNSTIAGALAASKLHIKVAHVEAGLRSFNRSMPEELNRIVTDHLSDLLLCPSQTAVSHLAAEGITRNVHLVGDVMSDALYWARQQLEKTPIKILEQLGVARKKFLLVTSHRSENTDDPKRLAGIVNALNALEEPVIFPVHPRTRKTLQAQGHALRKHVQAIDPVGYFEMVALTSMARVVLTDSGGLQKEAYWLGVPCITLRNETEWVETVETGWNRLVGTEADTIVGAVKTFVPPSLRPPLYGDGNVAGKCVDLLGA
jgi:UDP-N-acetylglucosamine 2-epimerase